MDQSDIDDQVEFNRWFKNAADDEGFTVIDTTEATIDETTAQVDEWISNHVSDKAF